MLLGHTTYVTICRIVVCDITMIVQLGHNCKECKQLPTQFQPTKGERSRIMNSCCTLLTCDSTGYFSGSLSGGGLALPCLHYLDCFIIFRKEPSFVFCWQVFDLIVRFPIYPPLRHILTLSPTCLCFFSFSSLFFFLFSTVFLVHAIHLLQVSFSHHSLSGFSPSPSSVSQTSIFLLSLFFSFLSFLSLSFLSLSCLSIFFFFYCLNFLFLMCLSPTIISKSSLSLTDVSIISFLSLLCLSSCSGKQNYVFTLKVYGAFHTLSQILNILAALALFF